MFSRKHMLLASAIPYPLLMADVENKERLLRLRRRVLQASQHGDVVTLEESVPAGSTVVVVSEHNSHTGKTTVREIYTPEGESQ